MNTTVLYFAFGFLPLSPIAYKLVSIPWNVKGAKIEGKVVAHGKGKKIIVFKYKAKKNYRRKQGHRQPYTKVEITSIKVAAEKAEKTEKTEASAKKSTAKVEE